MTGTRYHEKAKVGPNETQKMLHDHGLPQLQQRFPYYLPPRVCLKLEDTSNSHFRRIKLMIRKKLLIKDQNGEWSLNRIVSLLFSPPWKMTLGEHKVDGLPPNLTKGPSIVSA